MKMSLLRTTIEVRTDRFLAELQAQHLKMERFALELMQQKDSTLKPLNSIPKSMLAALCLPSFQQVFGKVAGIGEKQPIGTGRVVGWDRGGVRSAPKQGRNQPCPCGSGQKFKRCCGDSSCREF